MGVRERFLAWGWGHLSRVLRESMVVSKLIPVEPSSHTTAAVTPVAMVGHPAGALRRLEDNGSGKRTGWGLAPR